MDKSYDPFKYSSDSLEDVAEQISDVLKCPITIEDVNHRLLAYSTHSDSTDPARISTIIGRRVPEKVIHSLWKDGTIPALLKSQEPIHVKNIKEVGLGNRVAISIWKNNEVLGFIWAQEINKSLTSNELDLLKKAANAVQNKLLYLQKGKMKKEEREQEFFWKLLTGNTLRHDDMADGFYQLNKTMPPIYSVVLFRFTKPITEKMEKQLNYLLETTQLVHICLVTIDYNELILLVSPKEEQPLNQIKQFLRVMEKQMMQRYNIEHFAMSIGGIYSDISSVHIAYKEALAVLKVKERYLSDAEHLMSFSELGIYQYLDVLAEKRKHNRSPNYPLSQLEKYDNEHHSNLIETLETFIDSDSNVKTAAKQLNVHVNTLNYRLKRIQEITGLDLKNVNEKFSILLEIKIRNMGL
ncbi:MULTISPECIES: PucR family transcriptional regulator [Bacillus]|uniref:PucR family transcriptional regulator n=2 Tax=Bacillus TaxID=1386 RepID=A0A0M4FKG0_9BACI|nr:MULTISPECIES: PucR family transcriptional regulator [Bacillus]ALC82229.1 PucR family transcriptional regulator [Bacillus gobiensis]MBP1081076.1 DNA-binding PucR family transcriptional regulator [Bacillus capparidis]MED1095766.1 PucR family transcriptional regulator [Bacillus capparidis]